MDTSGGGLRTRAGGLLKPPSADILSRDTSSRHPGGPVKHGLIHQYLLMLAFVLYFLVTALIVHFGQLVVAPLYFINKNYYYAYMAWTKQNFGLMINCTTQWFCPTTIRISGDAEVAEQMRLDSRGTLQCDFPYRMVLMSNHQIYTDWQYLWWISYTSRMHGHIFIMLKDSLRYLPVIGPGMMFFGFIFMARNWGKDKPRMQHRLQNLNTQHDGPMSGPRGLDPMWLLIFPEGTNLSKNGRNGSAKWAEKAGLQDLQHALLPRYMGLQFCLQELEKTVDWVYDCTVAYEGVPRGEHGQDVFSLRSIYFQGQVPQSVNMYWRRFAVSSIPIHDPNAFDLWLRERWTEKDCLLEQYTQTGRFPASTSSSESTKSAAVPPYIETEVKQRNSLEFLAMYVPPIIIFLIVRMMWIWASRAGSFLMVKSA